MTRSFVIKADRIDIVNAFARTPMAGISIRAVPKPNARPPSKVGQPTIVFDSAADILEFVVHLGEEVAIGVFSSWLYDIIKKSGSKRTTLNGKPLPDSPAQITVVIQNIVPVNAETSNQQKRDGSDSKTNDE